MPRITWCLAMLEIQSFQRGSGPLWLRSASRVRRRSRGLGTSVVINLLLLHREGRDSILLEDAQDLGMFAVQEGLQAVPELMVLAAHCHPDVVAHRISGCRIDLCC